ncbi:Receptor-like protein kinase FERONIA [Sesamum alatum]|uniref:non-specific serine/threonine protein kinase n=1 Tax=Sesamum alatum TaxID=300844 RepID=A0AAE1XTC5_9LAMI|nr:Receptor-like protein kinase FERONIA [Sesamum alatum]
MNLLSVTIALLLLCFLNTYISATHNPTYFTDDISINSGSIGASSALNGREWVGDVKPKYPALLQLKGSSTTSTAIHKLMISADPIPHKTARISLSQFSYAFHVSPGQKIIRLHFNPAPYIGFKGLRDLFTVEAGPFTLLSNFSASLTAHALGLNSFAKEFCLNIQDNEQLILTFSPATSPSLDTTYAFINGIEIISVPPGLSYFEGGDTGVQVVGRKSLVHVDHNTALEIVHQLNIFHKQNPVPSPVDFGDTFPVWAMRKAKKKTNNTWKVPVDVGFRYLIRLHFSEIGLKIAGTGDVVFKVLTNEIIAQTNIDIVKEIDENNMPCYRDYLVVMRGHKKEGKRDILISLQSSDERIDGSGLLDGFEVLKLSNPDNSLSSPNPLPPVQHSPSRSIQTLLLSLGHRNAIATVAITLISVVNAIVHVLREIWEASNGEEENKPSARAERLCRRFSLAEIQLATRNFSHSLLIGKGGFGIVYKGLIDEGHTVAVKRLKSNSSQGAHEFLMEIETLSELRHVNLVSLIGYCNERGEMILVYDYMAGGTLADHLYRLQRKNNDCPPLTWKHRLNICIGAGRSLDYLHTGHGIIHRDVKSSNILLDENFVAKVSDFGLAKQENRSTLQSHVSTKVKGTNGYLDLHYINTGKLTRKSDTYAFGVVLLEVLCGRPAVDLMVPEGEHILSKWAQENISKGKVDEIVASSLRGEISEGSLKAFVEVAERCLLDEPKKRPTMAQVVLQLEFALEQQESKQLLVLNEIACASDAIHSRDNEIDTSVNKAQLTMPSTVQNLTPPPKELTKSKVANPKIPAGIEDARKATAHKSSRPWAWPLDAFWNRVKPSKKNESLLSETYEEIRGANTKSFDWDTIAAATNQFSSSSIEVGYSSFAPIYKGVLRTGQVVAVKRNSSSFRQGLKEFKNEILLLSNLQHPNITKLLGYCIHKEEKLLVYEFMQNGSVSTLIDEVQRQCLQWPVRFNIIMGIARGLLYLHQDSGLRMIHRDVKPSNILLDAEMNPKISNFEHSRSLAEHQTQSETSRVVGTVGYLPPENIFYGKLSFKLDVYSFGITVLEIVSARRTYSYTLNQQETNVFVLDNAWKLWNEGKAVELVEESVLAAAGAFAAEEALRCIQVALLCAQYQPDDRPEMCSVLKMLEGEELIAEPQSPWLLNSDHDATFEFDDTLEINSVHDGDETFNSHKAFHSHAF